MVNNNAPTANYSEFVLECRNTVKVRTYYFIIFEQYAKGIY